MDEKELQFDRSQHLIYSKAVKKIIQDQLASQYPKEQSDRLWQEVQLAYVRMLDLIPFMGARKNSQAQSVYDCAALFAFYEVVPDKPSLETFEEMNNLLFVPAIQRVGFANLNRPLLMKAAGCIWTVLSNRSAKHRQDWPGNYHMEMRDVPEGKKYVFLRCPIAELAKKLGYTHLMPAMCNPDYRMLSCLDADLIRTSTCAFGDCCDFWIVGSESKLLKDHPRKKNEAGFLYNE